MGKIIVHHRLDKDKQGDPIENYARSFVYYASKQHEILEIGEGHTIPNCDAVDNLNDYEWLIDIDSGRNPKGDLVFVPTYAEPNIKRAVWFIDSHGQPTLHKRLSEKYDIVFFAVWCRRDLFYKHKAAYWLPNCTDARWFSEQSIGFTKPTFQWGFYGSKGGIDRADKLKELCEKLGYSYDIREVARPYTQKWPKTGLAMGSCKNLFNRGQKHDGPNQRVMESLCMGRPLLNNRDPIDGISLLFDAGVHLYDYVSDGDLEEKMRWIVDNPGEAAKVAEAGRLRVMERHTMEQRVRVMLDTLGVK